MRFQISMNDPFSVSFIQCQRQTTNQIGNSALRMVGWATRFFDYPWWERLFDDPDFWRGGFRIVEGMLDELEQLA